MLLLFKKMETDPSPSPIPDVLAHDDLLLAELVLPQQVLVREGLEADDVHDGDVDAGVARLALVQHRELVAHLRPQV